MPGVGKTHGLSVPGRTQRADAAPETATGKFITIRFDANTADSLGWNFHPVQSVMKVKIGEQNIFATLPTAVAAYRDRRTP